MPLQKYPCWITNANFAVDNSLNLHIIRFYRRKWLLSSVRNDKSRLRFSVCSGIFLYKNSRLLFKAGDDLVGDFLAGEEHTAEDRSHAWCAGDGGGGHAADVEAGIDFLCAVYHFLLA